MYGLYSVTIIPKHCIWTLQCYHNTKALHLDFQCYHNTKALRSVCSTLINYKYPWSTINSPVQHWSTIIYNPVQNWSTILYSPVLHWSSINNHIQYWLMINSPVQQWSATNSPVQHWSTINSAAQYWSTINSKPIPFSAVHEHPSPLTNNVLANFQLLSVFCWCNGSRLSSFFLKSLFT